jgi:hypothetical protein
MHPIRVRRVASARSRRSPRRAFHVAAGGIWRWLHARDTVCRNRVIAEVRTEDLDLAAQLDELGARALDCGRHLLHLVKGATPAIDTPLLVSLRRSRAASVTALGVKQESRRLDRAGLTLLLRNGSQERRGRRPPRPPGVPESFRSRCEARHAGRSRIDTKR